MFYSQDVTADGCATGYSDQAGGLVVASQQAAQFWRQMFSRQNLS